MGRRSAGLRKKKLAKQPETRKARSRKCSGFGNKSRECNNTKTLKSSKPPDGGRTTGGRGQTGEGRTTLLAPNTTPVAHNGSLVEQPRCCSAKQHAPHRASSTSCGPDSVRHKARTWAEALERVCGSAVGSQFASRASATSDNQRVQCHRWRHSRGLHWHGSARQGPFWLFALWLIVTPWHDHECGAHRSQVA